MTQLSMAKSKAKGKEKRLKSSASSRTDHWMQPHYNAPTGTLCNNPLTQEIWLQYFFSLLVLFKHQWNRPVKTELSEQCRSNPPMMSFTSSTSIQMSQNAHSTPTVALHGHRRWREAIWHLRTEMSALVTLWKLLPLSNKVNVVGVWLNGLPSLLDCCMQWQLCRSLV